MGDGEFARLLGPPAVHWYHLFFNPRGNLNHARGNLLERFVLEAAAAERVGDLVSYALLVEVARAALLEGGFPPAAEFTLKVRAQGEDFLNASAGNL